MSRLPTVTAREMVSALRRAGFLDDGQRGSHLRLWHPERKFVTTVPVHPGDLPRPLVSAIMKQAGLSDEQLRGLL